jgi:DnaJ-class molecular chaperone
MKDYYTILEISVHASPKEIKEQFHFLMHTWHPDKFRTPDHRARAEEKSKEFNEAYEVLRHLVTIT